MHNHTNATVFIRYNDDQTVMVHLVVDCSDDSIGTATDRTTFATTIDRAYQSTIATAVRATIFPTITSTNHESEWSTFSSTNSTTKLATIKTTIR